MKQDIGDTVYGIHAVAALLDRAPHRVRELLFESGRAGRRLQALRAEAERRGIVIRELSRGEMESWQAFSHQGVVALIDAPALLDEHWLNVELDRFRDRGLLLVLDGVTDPHNFGACLRCADAAGVDAVIIPRDRSVGLTPVVRKVASGAAEMVPIVVVTNLARCLKRLQDAGIWLVGTDDGSEQTIYQLDLSGPIALVMGAEGGGMRRLTRERCDFLGRIPMKGVVPSLNVSVATGICLFEALRQRENW